MNLSQLWQRLDVLQKTVRFKVIASIVVLVLSIGSYAAIVVTMNSALPVTDHTQQQDEETPEAGERIERSTAEIVEERLQSGIAAAEREAPLETVIGVAYIVCTVIALATIWLGLAITYLGLALLTAAVAYPISLIPGLEGLGRLGLSIIPLVFILVTLLELARILLGGSHPVLAIARNLLNEAVRMKISLVFIVILLILLAVIPTALNEEQPLRYRVQQWMQYGTGFGYMVLALMTVFFCAASVAFEQRDKIIWQTVTKPVPAWAYITGKWFGVMVLNAVLLLVVSGGVFLFTQYLELQPAHGEVAYHRVIDRSAETGIRDTSVRGNGEPDYRTLDRRLLEDQVMVARVGVEPLKEVPDPERVEEIVNRRIQEMRTDDPRLEVTERLRSTIRQEILEQGKAWERAVPLGSVKVFVFTGLEKFYGSDKELSLRYQIHAGSNDPTELYTVGFRVNGLNWPPAQTESGRDGVRQVGLKVTQVMPIPAGMISDEGTLVFEVYNFPSNPKTIRFPPDGLELLYPAGGYELNFTRVCTVLLIKLGFIAAVAIALSTFLSFPVAVVVTLCVLFATESAGYMAESLGSFSTTSPEGNILPLNAIAKPITELVVWIFGVYTSLRPIESLSDGRLLSWGDLAYTIGMIGAWTLVMLTFGIAMFRNRELAIYSGH
ncbi:MAG: hypothetical protein ACF8MJ_00940 [Phycisphaerales bacterium JB050]